MKPWIKVVLSGFLTGVITTGGALMTGMEGGELTKMGILYAVGTGVVVMAKDWKTYLAKSPYENS